MNRAVELPPIDPHPPEVVKLIVSRKNNKKYSYEFDPPVARIASTPSKLKYQLVTDDGISMRITEVYRCDPYAQLCYISIAPDGQSMTATHVNTVRCLINLGIMLADPDGNTLYCDPEVINNPAGTFGSPGWEQ